MKTARELMESAVTVTADLAVRDLAVRLLDERVDGACVVDGERLVGVVTTMDLVFKEKQVHLPTMLYILDAVIPLGRMQDVDDELHKMASATVEASTDTTSKPCCESQTPFRPSPSATARTRPFGRMCAAAPVRKTFGAVPYTYQDGA